MACTSVQPARPALTERQRHVLEFIGAFTATHGYAPTMREIGRGLGIKSTNGVADHLKALERKGYLDREPRMFRTLRVVEARAA